MESIAVGPLSCQVLTKDFWKTKLLFGGPFLVEMFASGLSLQCRHGEGSKVLAGFACCEMLSKYPESAFHSRQSHSEKVFVSQGRVSGFPEKGADLRGSRELPGKFGKLLGNLWIAVNSTVRELPGKSPKNFWGSLGNFRGSPGTFQKLGEA